MLRFNTLLREAGVDPARVQLVRHQDTRVPTGATPYALWMRDRADFEIYQRLQSRDVFDEQVTLASFVVSPGGDTLFAGLFEVSALARNSETIRCPLWLKEFAPGAMNFYDIASRNELSTFAGLLTIDWGDGMRAWVQRAENQNKRVLEIRRQREDPPFPGFNKFRTTTNDLHGLPAIWAAVLGATGGVYLLVSEETGEQYVGSATGIDGFWSRWLAYAENGHGGNEVLRKRGKPPYSIVVLETASSLASRNDVVAAEQHWKERLGSRAWGLNGN